MSWFPKKCVVVPYDFSERSGQAIEIARDLVADLTHLHVIDDHGLRSGNGLGCSRQRRP